MAQKHRTIAIALMTATAVLDALDNLRSKELYMSGYYHPEINRFCLKGALHEHNSDPKKTLFAEYQRFEKKFKPEPNTFYWENNPQTAAAAYDTNINVNNRLKAMGFDMDLLDSLESFGFEVRDESHESDKDSAELRKNIWKRVRQATKDTIALLELIQTNPDLSRTITKLNKSLTVKYRYGSESVFGLDLPIPVLTSVN